MSTLQGWRVFDVRSLLLEIRFGEGGTDSKNFVHELAAVYLKYAKSKNILAELIDSSDGSITIQFTGIGVGRAFRNEGGKHVIQRVPDTETNGRRHTSTVTVAVMPLLEIKATQIQDKDLAISYKRGSGPGGQHRNNTNSCVHMKHIPTGLHVTIDGRDQHQNKKKALQILSGRVQDYYYSLQNQAYATKRKELLGDTGRGGARRTYNLIKGIIVDHVLNTKTNDIKSILKGNLDEINRC